ncbi:hypothetical protein SUGI_1028190 [Cryptomeria japonica]|uniref:uncharacterized protein LOC131078961 n=1 Tax=Cryptomeria japonica TaxID=3369 RepID=UPI002414759E|nr:uncharacterized protein LOC131078961 [Cryptomeria japonica]XP_057872799.2 uncharacterized protein LOC131078961 [Cryptomeria japonica]XP_057872800.2 uncharacterized protein LOC131078961 [Cryptomeria japonica]XP_057872801.2 uncharacterized protein LOC131078961 [Cryptomeria japonica]XP_057872802.2 uncharacterized protein LOC131078961 [Cryptomeria japonica]GLJ48755.1 hypothetical protein SUGI_1028190 [Cryptomeria japonica]
MVVPAKKKLLVLDVNGLLLDTYFKSEKRPNRPADGKVNKHFVYRRPYCNEFIEFCFENFEVGIWSSAKQHNVDKFIDFIFGDLRSKLLFSWHQAECTDTGLKTPGNRYKPVFLKELSKLWNKVKPDLPWEGGDYGPFNTLLIDDSPYKALRNPPYNAVFPYPYKVSNNIDDSLGGALRKYLEGLATASNVQHYVKHHPFGQPPISKGSPHWGFYKKIILSMGDQEASWTPLHQEYKLQSVSLDDTEAVLQSGNGQHSKSSEHIDKRRKKRRLHPASSTNEYSSPGMEEAEIDMVNAAIPNMEKSISLENREVPLYSGNGQHSESSSCVGKQKKKRKDRLVTSNNQSSVPAMEEGNGIVNVEKSVSLENIKVNIQSGNGQQSESSSRNGKRKKRRRNRLATSNNQSSVPGMKEENGVVNVAMLNVENRRVNLQSSNGQQSESNSRIGKRKKRRTHLLVTSTDQSSVPGIEEEKSVVNVAMLSMEKSKSLENRKVNLQSGNGQQSESSSWIGKRKKRHRDCLFTDTDQSSVLGKQNEENGVAEMAMPDVGKSRSITQDSLSQQHESCRIYRGYKDANLSSDREERFSQNSSFSNHKRKHKRFQDASMSRGSVPAMGYKEDGLAEAIDISMTNGYGTTVASFRQEHEVGDCKNKAVAKQTDTDHCGNKPYTTSVRNFSDPNSFRYGNKGHHYNLMNSNPRSSSHSQTNRFGDNQAPYIPRRFQANWGHQNGVNASIHTEVAEGGIYTSNKIYGGNAVHTNFPPYPLGGYIYNGQDRWQMQDGFHYEPPLQSANPSYLGYTVCQSYNPNRGAIEFRDPVMQSPFPNSFSHEQMRPTYYGTQHQGHNHNRNFHHCKNNSSSNRRGRR